MTITFLDPSLVSCILYVVEDYRGGGGGGGGGGATSLEAK
jgi:hypothetical protein